jgi:hypothetical protein
MPDELSPGLRRVFHGTIHLKLGPAEGRSEVREGPREGTRSSFLMSGKPLG